MRAHVRRILDTLTVLTALSRVTHSVPAPSNVSVTCDSYGVVVEWTATDLSEKADFLLEVQPHFGTPTAVITKYHRVNISDLLQETGYNRYFVKVKARDGGQESVFAESQIFSFSYLQTATIFCKLGFPTVTLFPRDGKLFVKFVNPLHVYRGTPALRDLMETEKLKYTLSSGKISENATCSVEERKCESNVSFPEEREEYCVTLTGRIRQTLVQGIEPYCYSGTLNPGPPVIDIVIPVLVVSVLFLLLSLATAFLVIFLSKKIKEKNRSMIPRFLEDRLTHTPLITPNSEPVAENPRVEPTEIPSNSPCDLQESTTQVESSGNGNDLSDRSQDEDMYNGSGSTEMTPVSHYNEYGYKDELSSSSQFSGYDRGHGLLEMSPGDTVNSYGS